MKAKKALVRSPPQELEGPRSGPYHLVLLISLPLLVLLLLLVLISIMLLIFLLLLAYRWAGCQGHETLLLQAGVEGVKGEADGPDQPLPDVIVAVGQAGGEVEQGAHPHGHLGQGEGGGDV